MPALEAFGTKFHIGSDDLVFPNLFLLCIRFIWFCLFGLNTNSYKCENEDILRFNLWFLTVFHIVMFLIEVATIYISGQGTIANPSPRKNINIVLYAEAIVFIVKFVLDIFCFLWAVDPSCDCPDSNMIVLLACYILVYNLITTVAIALYVQICRLPCMRGDETRHKKLGEVKPTVSSHGLLALSSEKMKERRLRGRVWQTRIRWLCCCVRLRERNRSVYADIGRVIADSFTYLKGYVLSDLAAGMALMAMKQKAKCNVEDPLHKDLHTLLDFRSTLVCAHYNRVVYYAKYAVATYGSDDDLRELVASLARMCGIVKEKRETAFKAKGDQEGWDIDNLKLLTCVTDRDIVYASFVSEVFVPAFYVVVDHTQNTVVVAIRGTFSIKDALTDLSAQASLLTTSETGGEVYGHKGMVACAHALQGKLENEKILERAFEKNQDYGLVLVGHSLGAGVASLLAILLKKHYQNLHCYAYSPPGGLLSMRAVPGTRCYITTVVVDNDPIPRLSIQSFQSFSKIILYHIETSTIPKYRIFLSSGLQWLGLCGSVVRKIGNRRVSVSTMAILKEPLLSTHFDSDAFQEGTNDEAEVDKEEVEEGGEGEQEVQAKQAILLFLPGKIIHIITSDTTNSSLFRRRPIRAHWTAPSHFTELVMDSNMIRDHGMLHIQKMLLELQKQENLKSQ